MKILFPFRSIWLWMAIGSLTISGHDRVLPLAAQPVMGPFYPGSKSSKSSVKKSNIELAKEAMFKDGNYRTASNFLARARQTEPKDPLVYAMSALYPFSTGDLDLVKKYGQQTIQTARALTTTNRVRGNLYQGVGLGIEAAYEFKKNGALNALNKIQKVFEYIDIAKSLSPNDPELNLIKGYMDLLLSVNLPFSDTNEAIAQLQKAQPKYLAYRGIYIGYRDLKQYEKAISAIDTAITLAPSNPELIYYKAQIHAMRGRDRKNNNDLNLAIQKFANAYQKRSQLLTSTVAQIASESCQAKVTLARGNNFDRCWEIEDKIKRDNSNIVFGPTKLPPF
jgi:tetratricopeptide (TPR) repeat protein